jgi:hypothetical protein
MPNIKMKIRTGSKYKELMTAHTLAQHHPSARMRTQIRELPNNLSCPAMHTCLLGQPQYTSDAPN